MSKQVRCKHGMILEYCSECTPNKTVQKVQYKVRVKKKDTEEEFTIKRWKDVVSYKGGLT